MWRVLEQKRERFETHTRINTESNKKILKSNKERRDSVALKNCHDGKTSKWIRETDSKAGAIKDNKDGIKILGDMFRNIYERQVRE